MKNVDPALTSRLGYFPLLQAERKGVSASEYGLVFGIFELVAFLSSPILGKYVSRTNLQHS